MVAAAACGAGPAVKTQARHLHTLDLTAALTTTQLPFPLQTAVAEACVEGSALHAADTGTRHVALHTAAVTPVLATTAMAVAATTAVMINTVVDLREAVFLAVAIEVVMTGRFEAVATLQGVRLWDPTAPGRAPRAWARGMIRGQDLECQPIPLRPVRASGYVMSARKVVSLN